MQTPQIYNTSLWDDARTLARARDGHRCTVSHLLGGRCTVDQPLHVHHIVKVRDGGDPYDLDNLGTTCAAHHPMWEALRQILVRRLTSPSGPQRCRHEHRSAEARAICERRLRRSVAA